MTIVNCTPHDLHLITGDRTITLPPSGIVPRAATRRQESLPIEIDGMNIPTHFSWLGEVEGLPPEATGTLLIVSALTAQAAGDRGDLLIVDDLVRDETGRIIGARSLAWLVNHLTD